MTDLINPFSVTTGSKRKLRVRKGGVNPFSVGTPADPLLEASINVGSQSDPDTEAKTRRDADELGVPASVLTEDKDTARRVRNKRTAADLKDYPRTSGFLSDPENVKVAHDDIDSLKTVERSAEEIAKLLRKSPFFTPTYSPPSDRRGRFDTPEAYKTPHTDKPSVPARVADAFHKGRLTHELGHVGYGMKTSASPEVKAQAEVRASEIKQEMNDLGVSNDGFVGFLTSAGEIVGQQYESLVTPEAAATVAAGAGTGAVVAGAGAVPGAAAGLVSYIATDSFIVEAGHSYLELKEAGTDEEVAQALSSGVGAINAGLEIAGVAMVAAPIKKALKPKINRAAYEVFKSDSMKRAMGRFAGDYMVAVGGETATEIMQEVVNISAEALAAEFGNADINMTYADVLPRVAEIANKTAKGMAVLALPGAGARFVSDRMDARTAIEADEAVGVLADALGQSPFMARAPEQMSQYVADAMPVEYVSVPVEHFDTMAADLAMHENKMNLHAVLDDHGKRSYDDAQLTGGDVHLPLSEAIKLMSGDWRPVLDKYRPHLRWNEDGMTAEEAETFQSTGLDEWFPDSDISVVLTELDNLRDDGTFAMQEPAQGPETGSAPDGLTPPEPVISDITETLVSESEPVSDIGVPGQPEAPKAGEAPTILGPGPVVEDANYVLPDLEKASPGPVEGVRSAATEYMKKAGLPVRHQATYVKVDYEFAEEVAEAYEKMPHMPDSKEVREAYEALAKETIAQYEAVLEMGIKFEFIEGPDPYDSPADAIRDMQENKHLWVFPTKAGFGSMDMDVSDNPLLADTEYEISGQTATVNDLFRAVHDVFGHGSEGASFGPRGEENAWQAHVRMFSPKAARAMTTETRGQNSWVNFGPHGEHNRRNPKDTIYADQKTGLLPEKYSTANQGPDVTYTAPKAPQGSVNGTPDKTVEPPISAPVDSSGPGPRSSAEDVGLNVADEVTYDMEVRNRANPSLDQDLQMAEDALGLQAIFTTLEEAGMEEKQFSEYLAQTQKLAETAMNKKKIADEKRAKAQVSREIKDYKKGVEDQIRESLRNEPVYAAMNGLQQVGLDQQSIIDALGEENGKVAIAELRKAKVKIARKDGSNGVPIDFHAELYGFDGGDIMVNAMRDAKPEKQEVADRVDRMARDHHPELFSKLAEHEANIEAMLNPDTEAVIMAEMKALSDAKDQRTISMPVVKKEVTAHMDFHPVKDLSVARYVNNSRRWGKEAGRRLRKGDRSGAKDAKVRQLFNIEFAKQVVERKTKVERGHTYLKKFTGSKKHKLADGYEGAIKEIVDAISLEPRLSRANREKLEKFVEFQQSRGMNFEIPKRLREGDKPNWKDMTFQEFTSMVNAVKQLEKFGKDAQAAIEQDRKTLIGLRTDNLVKAVGSIARTTAGPLDERRTTGERIRTTATEAGLLMATPDSILRDMDGDHLGPAYEAVKKSIDAAVTKGYKVDTNIGLLNREKKIAEDTMKLFSVFSSKELNTLSKEDIKVPGFGKPLSRNKQLTLLLNAGNEQNLQALYDSKQVTEAQMDSLLANASKRDLDFVQSVWDYLESFWPEISDAVQRRKGYRPEAVRPRTLNTKHGHYRGGYYFLRYDDEKAINTGQEDMNEAIEAMRFGRATASHTSDYHTEERKGSGGRPVMLDLGALNSHLNMVAYDLELGDAVNETYAVLHSENAKKAFRDAGQIATWRALDLWLGDTITGEMHPGGVAEKALRNLRAGFTISKIGWNVGVTLLQPLGLLQSSVQVGHRHMLPALKQLMTNKWWGEGSLAKAIRAESNVMNQREETFNKDIANVSRLVQDSLLARATSEGFADFVNNSMFYSIRKTQYLVDQWTYLAAKRSGMAKFDNDEQKAIDYAERMVLRSQATGVFHERAAFERGTLSSKTRQTELVRAFSPLMSFFIAKQNVAWERTKNTKFTSPVQTVKWAADMAMLYTLEAAIAAMIYGNWPDEDDEDQTIPSVLAAETVKSFFAGVPLLREFASEAVGFRGGGIVSFGAEAFGKLVEQGSQGEADAALMRAANNVGGILLKYPSGQINKTGSALHLLSEGEDVSMGELFMGPDRDKYR